MADGKQATDVDLARRIDLACDRFEGNWRLGRHQTLETFLVSVERTERDAYLKALLELELELRRQQGEVPQLQEYLVRFQGDQAIVNLLFESAGPQDSLVANRPTVDSQVDQTGVQQKRKHGEVRQVVPTEFGRYRIKHQIGAGGMGTVVLAEDTLLGRPVALKIPFLSGTDIDEQIKRFDREARTAAMLRHPNICPIYDFGEINGIRYISMAYIDGLPLHKYAAEHPLDEAQVARLMGKLAGALQDAHENGVVHRDLKPANIMMDKKGEPIVMDFGLAMQMQWETDVRLTQTGMQMGSPAYMPPEQVDGDRTRIGPAADIYSLGVALYELLTGRIPFEGPTASIFVQIIMKDPVRPSMLRAGLSPELEAICLKMMAKRIEDRYGSMAQVADALTEFVRRLTLTPVIANAPTTGLIASESRTVDVTERPQEHESPSSATSLEGIQVIDEEAELRLLLFDIGNALRDHQTLGLLKKVERYLELQPDNPAMLRLRTKLQSERDRGPELTDLVRSWKRQTTERHAEWNVDLVAMLRQGFSISHITTALRGFVTARSAHVTDVVRRLVESTKAFIANKRKRQPEHDLSSEPSPQGEMLESVQSEQRFNFVAALRAAIQRVFGSMRAHPVNTPLAEISGKQQPRFRDNETGEVVDRPLGEIFREQTASETLTRSRTSLEPVTLKAHTGPVTSVAFSPDGQRLASASFDGTAKLWDATSGQEALTLKGHTRLVNCVAFSADGKRLVSASDDQTLKMWDATSGQETFTLKGHTSSVTSVVFSADGKRLASASVDQTVRVWEAATGQETLTLKGHTGWVMSVAFSADGKRLASASLDQTVRVWDAMTGQETLTLKGHTRGVTSVVFSADGKRLASASADATVKVWDATSGQETLTLKGHTGKVLSVAFSTDGKRLASASEDQTVRVWDLPLLDDPKTED